MAQVSRLPLEKVGAAAKLLAQAFHADPILTFFLNDRLRRKVAYPAFFRALIYETWEAGHVYAAKKNGQLAGVSVWLPPAGTKNSPKFHRLARRNHSVVRRYFPKRAAEMYRGFENTKSLHPDAPHWYLFFIGVDPAFQGSGIGRDLMAPVLEMADRDGSLCYLETPFQNTHRFYMRAGFDLGPGTHPFKGAPTLWTMQRQPQSRVKR